MKKIPDGSQDETRYRLTNNNGHIIILARVEYTRKELLALLLIWPQIATTPHATHLSGNEGSQQQRLFLVLNRGV